MEVNGGMETTFPPQRQERMPAIESEMAPQPEYRHPDWHVSGLLVGKTVVVTGGDSGIGRAVAHLCAREGADVVVAYLDEHQDAEDTRQSIEELGRRCLLFAGDLADSATAPRLVEEAKRLNGRLDVLVQNSSVQYEDADLPATPLGLIEQTVRVNLLGALYLVRAALPSILPGGSVIVTTSVTAYRGSSHLTTYSATKGALASLVYALGEQLADKRIRVNGVAPGPVWTPLIVGSFTPDEVGRFGKDTPMGRAAQPWEVAPSYVFLASERWSRYITGQVIHPNGGEPVNA